MARQAAHLLILDGHSAGRRFDFSEPIRIGSSAECELCLSELAPMHATIEHTDTGTGYIFRSLHEDVFVDGMPALEFDLATHGMITIGPLGMIFSTSGSYVSKPEIRTAHATPYAPTSAVHLIAKLRTPRASAAVVALDDDRVVAIGGAPPMRGQAFADAEVCSISTRTVTSIALATARSAPAATKLLDGRILIAGGGTRSAEILDHDMPIAAMQAERTAATAFTLANGLVVVLGGMFRDVGPSAEVFDAARNHWGGLHSPSFSYARVGRLDAQHYLVTARMLGDEGRAPSSFFLFDSSNWQFVPIAPPAIPQWSPQLVEIGGGRVLVVGGAEREDKRTVAIFELATRTFRRAADMLAFRTGPAIAMLPNGHVLVVGGDSLDTGLYSAEVYDQAVDQWYALPPVWHGVSPLGAVARRDNSAFVVGIGNVSIAADAPW